MATKLGIKRHCIVSIFVAMALLALLSVPVHAQVAGATVTGTVTDPSGAVVPNAQIAITNTATGITSNVMTNSAGFYTIPNLIPGPYQVTIRADGFQTQIRNGITLTVGEQQVLNAALPIGQTSQTVEVTGEQPSIDLASSSISGNVDQKEVVELPLNGRDWTLLAALQPGVSSLASEQYAASTSTSRGNRGFGTQLSIHGNRPWQNNYRIDGISVNDYVNGGPGSVLGSTLGVDAISEFSVLSTNYSTEYGRTSGGVVNAITRSGTNGFHGDAYEFLRNSALDAATIVDNSGGIPKPPFRQNQFGVAAGGPIRKDRTFFFADYEGVRQSLGLTSLSTVLSQNARSGILNFANPASFPTGCVATAVANQCQLNVDSKVVPFLGLWPLPNAGLLSLGNTGNFAFAGQQVATENFVTARVDHKFSDKDSVFGSYQYDKGILSAPDNLDDVLGGNMTRRQLIALGETHIFNPQLVNNARFGVNRLVALNGYGLAGINPLSTNSSLAAEPGFFNPAISVSGLTAVANGLHTFATYAYHLTSFQAYDDAFLTKGKHGLKFGGGVERIDLNSVSLSGSGGGFTYGSIPAFLTNQGTGTVFSGQDQSSVLESGFRSTVVGAYLQDDIRWRPNLTLNLGIRYEMATVPNLINGQIATLLTPSSPLPSCGRIVPGCAPQTISTLFANPTLRNFEPRVGFAWDPFFKNGKTSVRGGFGIYDVLPLPYVVLSSQRTTAPFYKTLTTTNIANGAFPSGAFPAAQDDPHLKTTHVEQNPKRNYVMQWNLNVQRELVPSLTAMIAYVGSRGVHMMYQGADDNIVQPTLTAQGYLWPCGGSFTATGLCTKPGTGIQTNPNIGQGGTVLWDEDSFYHALDVQITKVMKHGFQVQGSYSWSRVIDEGTSGYNGDAGPNGLTDSLTFLDPHLTRGPADFNVTQALTINGTWLLPSPHSLPSAAGWLLGGWQIGGIYTVRTGVPFTVTEAGDPLGAKTTQLNEFVNRVSGPGCESPVNPASFTNYIKLNCFAFPNPSTLLGNAGRNSLVGPGLVNIDFSLFKNNYIRKISENFNVQFRAEAFNAFNRANFAAPTDHASLYNNVGNPVAGAGLLDLLATPAREIQCAIKLIW